MMEKTSLCVDANVFISAIIPGERFHSESLSFLKHSLASDKYFYEPEVVIFEVCHAFYRKLLQKEIHESDLKDFMDHFYRLPLLLQWQEKLMQTAVKMARKLSFPGIADCFYLAVAEYKNITLVTWDEDLIRKGKTIYSDIQRVDHCNFA